MKKRVKTELLNKKKEKKIFFFKQETEYEIKECDWSSDVCSSDLFTAEHEGKTYHFCSEGCRDKFLHRHRQKESRPIYDLIIIGGGPAGLAAAVYAATLKIDTFVATTNLGGQAIDSTKIGRASCRERV